MGFGEDLDLDFESLSGNTSNKVVRTLKQWFVSLGPLGGLLCKGIITGIPTESFLCVESPSWFISSLIDKRVLALKTVSRSGVLTA